MIRIPAFSLVVLIGPTGSGKSTFAARHFGPTEVLSSDACRAMIGDDEDDQAVTAAAFEVLHFIAAKRLAAGRLTVIDATNVRRDARRPLLRLAREHACPAVAVVFDLPEPVCREHNRRRPGRLVPPGVLRKQHANLQRSLEGLQREGFEQVTVLTTVGDVDGAVVTRTPP